MRGGGGGGTEEENIFRQVVSFAFLVQAFRARVRRLFIFWGWGRFAGQLLRPSPPLMADWGPRRRPHPKPPFVGPKMAALWWGRLSRNFGELRLKERMPPHPMEIAILASRRTSKWALRGLCPRTITRPQHRYLGTLPQEQHKYGRRDEYFAPCPQDKNTCLGRRVGLAGYAPRSNYHSRR